VRAGRGAADRQGAAAGPGEPGRRARGIRGIRGVRGVRGSRVREDIREGWRWLWAHPAVRTLAITIFTFTFTFTFGAAWSVLVLYARERLGMSALGFGLLATASAAGGLLGMVIGSAIGGAVASAWGVTAPFWFGFAGSAVILALIWRSLLQIAHDDENLRAGQPG
jgi:MFS family permease